MTIKDVVYSQRARRLMLSGVDALADAVRVTLGPRGRNVVLERGHGAPTVTKDGATVASTIELDGHFENMGAQMLREVAAKTNDVAGDGTTTAIVLAQAILREGSRLVAAGEDPMALKRGIDRGVEVLVSALKVMAMPTRSSSEIAQVGRISANGDREIGERLAEAMERVGREGVISVEEGTAAETTLEVTEGMQIGRGYLSPYFVTNAERMQASFEDCYVLVSAQKLASMKDLLTVLEAVSEQRKPLVIFADDVEGEALATLVVNKLRGTLDCAAVKGPGYGDQRKDVLADIAALTGARLISSELGLSTRAVGLEGLGRARRITIDKDSATIVGGGGAREAIDARIQEIRARLTNASRDSEIDLLKQRLAKLVGGVAVLKVGALTELALKEAMARAEDALNATRAAVEEGIVPGGGVALLRSQSALDGVALEGAEQAGLRVLKRALEEPLRRIAINAGLDGALVVARVREGSGSFGYDAERGSYGDLLEAGIIDPAKVVRTALQNAAGVAGLMLTTVCLIAEHQELAPSFDA